MSKARARKIALNLAAECTRLRRQVAALEEQVGRLSLQLSDRRRRDRKRRQRLAGKIRELELELRQWAEWDEQALRKRVMRGLVAKQVGDFSTEN